jgi:glycosyltransferase 2 family protein
MKQTILTLIKTILPLGVGIYLFWLFFSSMSEEHIQSFKKAIREANYFWVFLAMVLEFISLWSRAERWKYMLEPMGYQTPWKNRYHSLMIGYLANYTLPRAGEPTRSVMLFRSNGVPFAKSFGTIIAERAVDVLMLGLVTGIALVIGYNDLMVILSDIETQFKSTSTQEEGINIKAIIYFVFAIVTLVGLTTFFINKTFRNKLTSFIQGIFNGVFAIFKTKHPFAFIAHTFLIWICWILMFVVPFFALKETANVPFSGMLIGFIVGSIGMSFTNGGIGIYPLIVGLVVSFYLQQDYPTEARGIGNALGMIIWLGNTAIMILLGLISLVLLPKKYGKNEDTSRQFNE